MTRRPDHGIVRQAWLDVRASPDHKAEMKSQLLLGEVVRILARRGDDGWWRIENLADGYRGWVRAWGLVAVTAARAAEWRRRATARVVWPVAEVSSAPADGSVPRMPAPLNARLIPGPTRGGMRRVALPDGGVGWLPAPALAVAGRDRPDLVSRIATLIGVPYLWGGRTPAGFDCSGFAQQVLAEAGVALPRDAHQQWRASRPLAAGEPPRTGDLVFFAPPRRRIEHVGIWLGDGVFAHCRGQVGFNSLDSNDKQLFHSGLHRQLRGIRRPAPKGPSRA